MNGHRVWTSKDGYGKGPHTVQHRASDVRTVTVQRLLKIAKRFEKEERPAVRNINMGPVVRTFNRSTQEPEAGGSMGVGG